MCANEAAKRKVKKFVEMSTAHVYAADKVMPSPPLSLSDRLPAQRNPRPALGHELPISSYRLRHRSPLSLGILWIIMFDIHLTVIS